MEATVSRAQEAHGIYLKDRYLEGQIGILHHTRPGTPMKPERMSDLTWYGKFREIKGFPSHLDANPMEATIVAVSATSRSSKKLGPH